MEETTATNIKQNELRINRREFLNLAWLASLGYLLVTLGGVTYLFALPRFREREFGGLYPLGRVGDAFPAPGGEPINVPQGRFWLVRTPDNQVAAIYKVCTHLGCLYNWDNANVRFQCPCHGSQFQLDGTYIRGPAPRSLDRFIVRLLDLQGNEVSSTDTNGNPLPLPNKDLLAVVETGQLIRGQPGGVSYPVT